MGSTRDFIAATLADAMLPAFRRPVEDVIYETLDRRQVPTRTDFKELRDLVNSLRGQLTGATNGVRTLADRAEAIEDRLNDLEAHKGAPQGLVERLDAIEKRVADLEKRLMPETVRNTVAEPVQEQVLAQIDERLARFAEQLTRRLDSAPKAESKPADDARAVAICKVEGCDERVRARGFCAPHYQKWRRGKLEGFEPPRKK